MKIYISEKTGNIFWFDTENNLCSTPLNSDDTLVNTDEPKYIDDGHTGDTLTEQEEKDKQQIITALRK